MLRMFCRLRRLPGRRGACHFTTNGTFVDHFAHEEELAVLLKSLRASTTVHALHGPASVGKTRFAFALMEAWKRETGKSSVYVDLSAASAMTVSVAQTYLAQYSEAWPRDFLGSTNAPGGTGEKTLADAFRAQTRALAPLHKLVLKTFMTEPARLWSGDLGLLVIDGAQSIGKLGDDWADCIADVVERTAGRCWRLPVLYITNDFRALMRDQNKLARSVCFLHAFGEQSKASAARHWRAVVAKAEAEHPCASRPHLPFSDVWAKVGGHPGHLEMLGRDWCSAGATDLDVLLGAKASEYEAIKRDAMAPPSGEEAAGGNPSAAVTSARAQASILAELLESRRTTGFALGGMPLLEIRSWAQMRALESLCSSGQRVTALFSLPLKPGPDGFDYAANREIRPFVQFASNLEARAVESGFTRAAEAAAVAADKAAAGVAYEKAYA